MVIREGLSPLILWLLQQKDAVGLLCRQSCSCLTSTKAPKPFSTELLPTTLPILLMRVLSSQVRDLIFVRAEFCKISSG